MAQSLAFILLVMLCFMSAKAEPVPLVVPTPQQMGPIILVPEQKQQAGWEEYGRLDFDKNGFDDAVLEVRRGSGPLSTYFGEHRLRTLNGTKLLMNGAPLAPGSALTLRHVFEGVDETPLFSLAVSLRVKLRPEEAARGPWWRKQKTALGIVRINGDDVSFGFVLLSVSDQGKVTVDGFRLERVQPTIVEVPK